MPSIPDENTDPWEPGEHIPDMPEYAEDIVDFEEDSPSTEEADEFFSRQNDVEKLMGDIAARQRAAALGKAAEKRARETYAREAEEKRKNSPNRTKPSGEVFNQETRTWKKLGE